ncbi:MAG: trigger factor [Bacteroidales bacterium]
MNITHESTGELTATLKIEVSESDYIESVNKKLKEYQRKANMPGFRPGKVPFGLIKKMYWAATVLDEVNHLVAREIPTYISDNKLEIIGYPIPDNEKVKDIDLGSQQDFELYYVMGFRPDFDLKFSDEIKPDYYKIVGTEKEIEDEIAIITRNYSEVINPEISEAGDWIDGKYEQLGEDGEPLPDGLNAESYVNIGSVQKEDKKAVFIGLKEGDHVSFNIREIIDDGKEIERIFKLKTEEASAVDGMFRFTVSKISRMIPAEVNEELFKKLFPNEENIDEARFRELIRENITLRYEPESDSKLFDDVKEKLMELHDFNLPEEFLKKLLLDRNEDSLTKEDIDTEFPELVKSIKWDMIREKIYDKFDIRVSQEEKKNVVRSYFKNQFGGNIDEQSEWVESTIDKILSDQKESERIEAQLYYGKLISVMKSNLGLQVKEVTHDEFHELTGSSSAHDHEHEEHTHETDV